MSIIRSWNMGMRLAMIAICMVASTTQLAALWDKSDSTAITLDPERYRHKVVREEFKTYLEEQAAENDFGKLNRFLLDRQGLVGQIKERLSSAEYRYVPGDTALFLRFLELIEGVERATNRKTQIERPPYLFWTEVDSAFDALQSEVLTSPPSNKGVLRWTGQDQVNKKVMARLLGVEIKRAQQEYRKGLTEINNLRENYYIVLEDITSCKYMIDDALDVNERDMRFRKNLSLGFGILVALIITLFFALISKKREPGNPIGDRMTGENGLQFMTLFILIATIGLFGVMGILKGSELAALLAGISGYILGKNQASGFIEEKVRAMVSNRPVNSGGPDDSDGEGSQTPTEQGTK